MPTRIDEGRCSLALADDAPRELLPFVRSVLESDELLGRLDAVAKPGVNSHVARVEIGEGEAGRRRYALKRYTWPIIDSVRTLGRRTRARAEFEALEALAPLVPVPVRPAAWGERRAFGFALRSVLVTELVEGALDLKTWRLAFVKGQRPAAERERLVAALPELARLVRRLHDAGFHARTAFHKNILWRPEAEAREAFSLLDLPFASRSAAPLGEGPRLEDLACLDKDASMVLPATTRLRFFLAYREAAALAPADRRALRAIAALRARREHSTPFWRFERRIKRSLKRTFLGKLLTGRDPDARRPGAG